MKTKFPKSVKTLVYCGPTIPGVVRENTAFQEHMPQSIHDFAEKCPTVTSLIVDLAEFPKARRAVRTPGTALFGYYNTVKNYIKEANNGV